MMRFLLLSLLVTLALTLALAPAAAQAPDAAALTKEGQTLLGQRNLDGALEKFRAAVAADPQRYDAQDALGRALDLAGKYAEAREHLERAIALAPESSKNQALTTMGTSFAFEARAEDAARYYRRAFDAQMEAKDPAAAAATANALGRVYLESGNTQKAEQWYRTGYETARHISHRPAAQLALWDMRWEHALGRIAARRGRRAQALQHAAAVRRLMPKVADENQRPFYPYLVGYIDFYTHHYREAVASLKKGNQEDVFVLGLIAQSYRKLHDAAHAHEYFERVLAGMDHNINAAFSRPAARAYLKGEKP
ncbi:MAG TPA: tetratricopeptide repeat protein [Vicinamibacterales bacterium]